MAPASPSGPDPTPVGRPLHALTVDVEDWFHPSTYSEVVDRAGWGDLEDRIERSVGVLLDTFDEHDARATFFVLGWIAERHPQMLADIHERGHEVGSHGFSHRSLHELSVDQFAEELHRTNRAIEQAVGAAPRGFRAPDFSLDGRTAWALDCLIEQGYRYDSSVYPVRHRRYGVPDFPRAAVRLRTTAGATIDELPLTTRRVGRVSLGAAGGAYLRLLPKILTTSAFAQMESEGRGGCLYVHPWEVDDDQPRLPVDPITRFRHNGRTGAMPGRLGHVLSRFRFAPAGECLAASPPTLEASLDA